MANRLIPGFVLLTVLLWISISAATTAYVLNGRGETLSKIDLETDVVTNDFISVGMWPNQIVVQGDSVYVVNSGDNNIQIISLVTETTVGYVNLPANTNPYWMEFVGTDTFCVSALLSHKVWLAKVSPTADTIKSIPVGQSPEGLLKVGNKLYICCTGWNWITYTFDLGYVYVIDLETYTVTDSIRVGLNPQYLDLDCEGELNVTCSGVSWTLLPRGVHQKNVRSFLATPGYIYTINTNTDQVMDSIGTGGYPGIISCGCEDCGRYRHTCYIAAGGWHPDSGKIYQFDSLHDILLKGETNPIKTDSGVIAVSYYCGDTTVFSCNQQGDNIAKLDKSGNELKKYLVGDGPQSIAFYPPPVCKKEVPLLDDMLRIALVIFIALSGSYMLIRMRRRSKLTQDLLKFPKVFHQCCCIKIGFPLAGLPGQGQAL